MSNIIKDINVAYYEALDNRMAAARDGDTELADKFESLRVKIGDILVKVERNERHNQCVAN